MLPDCAPSTAVPGTRAMAEFTATTRPCRSTSGPPELPGLIAASVWMALMNAGSDADSPPADTGRFSALTMPVVTVPCSPRGAPMAITSSPTTTASESPNATTGSPVRSTRSAARS
ncbi:hypothetical protein GCM10025868_12600 [Angustibacter aerolatus]|uniref:Uncharacterized protein n=1 Tax=Angustibacter aerolatus TaxID=1162965 RepID=A0ABQ6JCV7_9ACTN|nr:hypothetical protein GCM10025868_12600 [Angustibacter aerolatus]